MKKQFPKIGNRVHVKCICGDDYCKAPANKGGTFGKLIDIQTNDDGSLLYSVVLDNHHEALDFPGFSVTITHESLDPFSQN